MTIVGTLLTGKWVTLDCDPAEEESGKTRFWIEPISVADRSAIGAKNVWISKDGNQHQDNLQFAAEHIRASLKKVENCDIPFETEVMGKKSRVKAGFIEQLPMEVIIELGAKIMEFYVNVETLKKDLDFTST